MILRSTYSVAGQMAAVRVTGYPDNNNRLFYYYNDYLDSTAVVVRGSTGAVIGGGVARYLPFGDYRTTPTQTVTDRHFTGHKHNDDLGLVYMNARFYVPSIGRFVSADTLVPDPNNPQSYNRYSYVRNNPVNFTDPTGHRECSDLHESFCGIPPLPESERYYCTSNYGCFDIGHIRPKNVDSIASQIETGQIVIRKPLDVSRGVIEFRAHYSVSDQITEDQLNGVILGILMDSELRFEQWQGTLPFGAGDKSSFSIEDLPSDYLGFYIGLNYDSREYRRDRIHSTLAEVFALLGGAKAVDEILHPWTLGSVGSPMGVWVPTIGQLDNTEFSPLIYTDGEWQNVPWPDALQMTPIESSETTWQFEGGGTCIPNIGLGCNR